MAETPLNTAGGFVKIYGTILRSSIWSESLATRIVWITMLALADKHGYVEGSVPGLARMANVSSDDCRIALQALSAPDPDSKTPDHDGRRIAAVDRGWMILNYQLYREMQTEKQATDAERARRYRERQKDTEQGQSERDASRSSREVALEEEGEAEAKAVTSTSSTSSGTRWRPVEEAEMADRLTTDAGRVALAGVLHVARLKSAVVAELNACLSGDRGPQHQCSFPQLDVALSDYFAGGMSNGGTWNPNHFRACIRTAMRVPVPDIRPAPLRLAGKPVSDADAAQSAVAAIRGLIETEGRSRFIRRSAVEALGPAVLTAYDSLGGADRFLNIPADKLPWLVKEFASALRTTHAA